MPTNNPVTRFGRGFHGFDDRPKPILDLSGAKPNAYGPGVDRVPKGSTRYTIGNTGKPLRPGDAAVSPDLVRKYGLKNGDVFTYRGKTYRYNDQSWVNKNTPNVNTVEIWYPAGERPGPMQTPRSSQTNAVAEARPRELGPDEWQSSKEDRRFLPQPAPEVAGSGRESTGRSATLTTNPNDDWIGATPETSPLMRPFDEMALADNSGSYVDAIYPETTVAEEPFQIQNFYDESGNNWWSQPESQSEMTAADRGEGRSVFGAADTATGQSWDTLVSGGSEQGSHAFEFIETDTPSLAADEGSRSAVGRSPSPITDTNDDWIGNDESNPDLLANEERPPGATEIDPNLFVRRNELDFSGDRNNLPSPNLASFGLSPLSATQTGSAYVGGNVGGGLIQYANNLSSYTPGDEPGTAELAPPSSEAEAQGARETAALRARGQLPPSTENAPGTSGSGPLTATQYNQQTFGGLRGVGYRETTGSATGYGASISSQENAKLMASTDAMRDRPNFAQPDEPTEFFGANIRTIDPITGERTVAPYGRIGGPAVTARSRLLTTAAGRAKYVASQSRAGRGG